MKKRRTLQGTHLILTILLVLWVVLILGVALLEPTMLNPSTVTTILQFSTILALAALGQALVVLAGGAGIDLSVGGIVSLTAVGGLMLVRAGLPPILLPIICILFGTILGLINGWLVTRLAILPLIATLGTFFIYSGLALAVTGGAAQSGVPEWLLSWGRGAVAGLPLPFFTVALPSFIATAIILNGTAWGRWIYAMGFDEKSARLVGIGVDRTRMMIYATSGLLCGAAGLVSIAWLGSGRPNIGQNLELASLTAAMLGGILITGGRGGVGGVLAAVILLVTLQTSLLQLGVNTVWQLGIVGCLLIFVLLAERLSQRWR
ncbi:ABC transporter permease [Oryzifoliimicrobium ureilyticus]|uniref:ABC transporter permease n=1 Tax=Oryzifoliimicrobium ureilyticus TaxID=3113724 RepID=UPI00307610CE